MTHPTIETEVIRNCRTCAHCVREIQAFSSLDRCSRAGGAFCEHVRLWKQWNHACDAQMHGWQPRPPRRSLRQWLYDTLLA